MIRILHSVSNMDRAGAETMLMNLYRHMDRERIQFDFLQNKKKPGDYDEEIRGMGGRLFVSPGYTSYKNYMRYMTELFSTYPEYRIMHAHNGPLMVYALKSAKINNIPVRIAHSHSTSIPIDFKSGIKICVKPMIKHLATEYWGCSNAAGEYMFSKKYWNKGHELIHNAVDVNKFTFNESARRKLREQYGLGNKFVVGHVGRLTMQKNHKKLIEVFAALHEIEPDSQLVLVGTGELEEKLKNQVAELGLNDVVTFTGMQTNVDEWYSAFDVFVMPSLNEGLPVVGVEAQAADLPYILSDTITREAQITDKVKFMSLKDDAKTWALAILDYRDQERCSRFTELQKAGYDISTEAGRLQELYFALYERSGGGSGYSESKKGVAINDKKQSRTEVLP